MELAKQKLGSLGRGIEIGGSAFNVFEGVEAWNLDYPSRDVFEAAQERIASEVAPLDVLASAEAMPVADGALDFILNSHVIEHMPDTIRALGEWDRCVRPGGVLFFIVPHRDRTFDRVRPVTALAHHLADYALENSIASDPLVPTSHYHVWRTENFIELIEYLNARGFLDWEIEAVEDVDSKVGNGFTVVARKRSESASWRSAGEDDGAPVAFHQLTPRFPFQVVGRSLETIVPGPLLPEPPDVPRGLYRVAPILDGFPPRAGRLFDLEVGPTAPPPTLEAVERVSGDALFRGRDLYETTWLEATFPNGTKHSVLPEYRDGALALSLEGLALPDTAIPVVAESPPPGGGRSEPLSFRP